MPVKDKDGEEVTASSGNHCIKDAVKAGVCIVSSTPEYIAQGTPNSLAAQEDLLEFAAAGKILAIVYDEAHLLLLHLDDKRSPMVTKLLLFMHRLNYTAAGAGSRVPFVALSGTFPEPEPQMVYKKLNMKLEKLVQAPVDRQHVTIAFDDVPYISTGQGATLTSLLESNFRVLQAWADGRDGIPANGAIIIFVHSKAEARDLVGYANAVDSCTCWLRCSRGEGCRTLENARAIRYDASMSSLQRKDAFEAGWMGGARARSNAARILVATPCLDHGVSPANVVATFGPTGPQPSLSRLVQAMIGRCARASVFPAITIITLNWRLAWRVVFRSGPMEDGSAEAAKFNAVVRWIINGRHECSRDSLLRFLNSTDKVPTCQHGTPACCSACARGNWSLAPPELFRDATDHAKRLLLHIFAERAKRKFWSHASIGRVLGFREAVAWRCELTERQATRIFDSLLSPAPGAEPLVRLYRPAGHMCLCVAPCIDIYKVHDTGFCHHAYY